MVDPSCNGPVGWTPSSLGPVRDDLERLYGDVLGIWRPWAPILRGHGIDCGHHMAEEAPEELARELLAFLAKH